MTGDGTAAGQGPDLPPGQRPAGRWLASHYGKVPQVDGERWRLTVREDGRVEDDEFTIVTSGGRSL